MRGVTQQNLRPGQLGQRVDVFQNLKMNIEAMAAAFIRLKDDPSLKQRLGERAREKVSEAFSSERYTDRLLDRIKAMPEAGAGASTDILTSLR